MSESIENNKFFLINLTFAPIFSTILLYKTSSKRGNQMVRKKKKKNMGIRIIVAVGAFVLIGFIMLIANAFWGNPISKTIAKSKIEKYVHQVYSLDSKIEKVSYDFYNQFYVSKVRINNQNLDIKSRSNLIYDKNVYDYFQKKFDKDYSAACLALNNNNSIEFPQGVDILPM